jgi:hypothetical protein
MFFGSWTLDSNLAAGFPMFAAYVISGPLSDVTGRRGGMNFESDASQPDSLVYFWSGNVEA